AQAFVDTWTWDNHANEALEEIQSNYQGKFTSQTIDLIDGLTKVLGKGSLLAYLVSITLRIVEVHRVLKSTGSFYLHCDPTASHYLKIVLDTIFCSQKGEFQNEIIWCYSIGGKSKNRFGKKHDVILFYTKSNKEHTFNQKGATIPRKQNSHMKVGTDSDGRQYQEKKDSQTNKVYRYYLDEGKIAEDYWTDIETLNREDRERLGYPTQKPEALLERIIKASSNKGDIILDAYCGCGTTIAVAERLERNWIGIDITYQSISLMLKRLEDSFGKNVLDKIELNGIPKDIESAKALATKPDDRTRKEFEKWAVLTYSNNRAVINDKKGADKGIDAIAYFQGDKDNREKIIFQVKSGNIKSGDIRELQGTMTIQGAALGIFITLKPPSKDMIQTAKSAGIYRSRYRSQSVDKIEIVTVQEILEQKKRLDVILTFEVLKAAEKQRETQGQQMSLDIPFPE
ncbi:MAG: DNA methyltransferase, partial [Microcystis aeruginosa]